MNSRDSIGLSLMRNSNCEREQILKEIGIVVLCCVVLCCVARGERDIDFGASGAVAAALAFDF